MRTLLHRLQQNWKSGLTLSLVSIPLSVSLAVAANATPVMGVITAMWAGLFAALFGSSNYNIVGPTGALSGILAGYTVLYGMEALPILAIFSGLMILLFYLFHIDRYLIFIPSSVIHGFTLGVAFIIALNQLNFALGLKGLPVHEGFIENIAESLKHLSSFDPFTVGLFVVGLIFLFAFLKVSPKFPGPIFLAPMGILLGYLSFRGMIPFELQTLYTKFGAIDAQFVIFPSWGHIPPVTVLVGAAFAVTVIGVLETLISGKIADGMTKTKFNSRREVLGLGVANMVSGFCGGIPATAALARTALNVKTGATHRTSAAVSSVGVAIISLVFLSSFQFLPLAIVASILVYVAARMISAEHFTHLYHYDRVAFCISLLVAFITVVRDPIIGIFVGATLSLLIFVNKLSKAQNEITLNKNKALVGRLYGASAHDLDADVLVYRFAGQMTYVNAQSHRENVTHIHDSVHTVILAFRNLFYMDMDGVDAMAEIVETLEGEGKKVMITGAGEFILPLLSQAEWFSEKEKRGEVFVGTTEALEHLGLKAVHQVQPEKRKRLIS